MRKSVLSLAVAGATLASASVIFSANPVQAFDITYDWSFLPSAPYDHSYGTFVADSETGLLSSITGVLHADSFFHRPEIKIIGLLPGRDSKIPLGEIYFETEDGVQWVIHNWVYPDEILTPITQLSGTPGGFGYAPQPVPEPLTILGSGIALGFGGFLKRKLGKNQKD
jgi:hypothetical protein